MFNRLHILGLGLFIVTGACTSEKGDSAGDDGTGSTSTTSTGEVSTSTGDASTIDPTADVTSASTSDAPTTGDESSDSTADTDTGGVTEIVPECQAVCDKLLECGFSPDIDGCAEECSLDSEQETGECKEAALANLACQAGLTCEQLIDSIDGEQNPCSEIEETMNTVCEGDEDFCTTGGGGSLGDCDYSVECRGEAALKMTCDDNQCTCTSDDEPYATCNAEEICDSFADVEALESKFETCCTF